MIYFNTHFGAEVRGRDGVCGKLAGIVVDAEAWKATDLIVKEGFLLSRSHILPISLLEDVGEDNIVVFISSHELDQYPEYRVTEYEEPAPGYDQRTVAAAGDGLYGTGGPVVPMVRRKIREGIATGQVIIEAGMPVHNLDGAIGKVDRVIIDRVSKKITHVIVQRGLIFADQRVVPISTVEGIYEDGISVAGTNEAFERFSKYAPDTSDYASLRH